MHIRWYSAAEHEKARRRNTIDKPAKREPEPPCNLQPDTRRRIQLLSDNVPRINPARIERGYLIPGEPLYVRGPR